MNLMVVGVSYRTASLALLERLAATAADTPVMLTDLLSQPHVGEAAVLSTCNRVEIYAGVGAFHGGLADIVGVLAARAGCTANDLAPHLYVHYEADAARHMFRVATGLDSLVVGEPQILGQLRDAYGTAAERDTAGRLLHDVMRQALRVGKRAHAETGIDRAGQNVVTGALELAARHLERDSSGRDGSGGDGAGTAGLAGRSALVVGAGAMGALALATLRRSGAGHLYITNRDPARAGRLADQYGATPVPLDALADAVSRVDLVICATAATGHVLTPAHVRGPVVIIDLGVPRDVDPDVGAIDGVSLVDLELLAAALRAAKVDGTDEAAVEAIVAAEVEAYRIVRRGADVAPTVAALRARADDVVAAELGRLRTRRPDLSDGQRADVAHAVHRVVQRLLHLPTVRVREFAAEPGGDRYAEVLRELFDLDVPPIAKTVADVPVEVTLPDLTVDLGRDEWAGRVDVDGTDA